VRKLVLPQGVSSDAPSKVWRKARPRPETGGMGEELARREQRLSHLASHAPKLIGREP